MALTKTDISQLRKVFREEIEVEAKTTRREFKTEVSLWTHAVARELSGLTDKVKDLEISDSNLHKKFDSLEKVTSGLVGAIATLSKQIKKLDKKIVDHFDFLDKDFTPRIKRLEENAGLPPLGQN